MCGLFGHTDPRADLERSRSALHRLSHRGPDQWGEWFGAEGYFGHRRLSIMDLSIQGRQPMLTDDEQILVCANGEIFNHKEIRRELEGRFAFRSESDSEVLLHGYRAFGIDGLVERIEGMYAFILLDRARQKLYLVRDRVGVKPLYYGRVGGTFAWASELKALETYFGDRLNVDPSAFYDFLTYLYVPAPKSMYAQIHKLEAAHYVEVDLPTGGITDRTYWTLPLKTTSDPEGSIPDDLRARVREAVDQQLMSDVPVGFFLSGGMDSSVVVAEAAGLSDRLHTYSIGFDVPGYSETSYARIVAEHFGTDHTSRTLSREDVAASFHQLRDWYDEPFADTSAFPTHLVSALAREGSTVVLTGDGGDELFGGYKWYERFDGVSHRLRPATKASLRERVRMLAAGGFRRSDTDGPALYAEIRGRMLRPEKEKHRAALGIPIDYDDYWHYRRFYREDLPPRTRAQVMDFHGYLPDQILTKVDRASMAVSLEARVPLLATRLIEFAFSLPEGYRYTQGRLKGVMKDAYAGVLPSSILERGKKGFSIPLSEWKVDLLQGENTRQEFILKHLYGVDL